MDGSRHPEVRAALAAAGVSSTQIADGDPAVRWSVTVVATPADVTSASFAAALATAPASLLVLARAMPAGDGAVPLRELIDRAAIAARFRRHALLFSVADYAEIEHEQEWILVPLERLPDALAAQYPLEWLARDRDLHMDMTREAGRRSDAHLARYAFASRRLPATGRILDTACGLGYGTALLAREVPGRTLIGVDIDPAAIDYARQNFGASGRVAFETQDVVDLSRLPARSVDAVVSFETVEHVADAPGFLRELHRVTKEGAPIIASVPYRWVGTDLGPYHVDWYDVWKLIRLFSRAFVIDDIWCQTAGGGQMCGDAPRAWHRLDIVGPEPTVPTEWLVIAARRAPVRPRRGRTTWVFLAPGLPQFSTMLAAMRRRRIAPETVTAFGCSTVADDGFHDAMRGAADAFGVRYAGNLFTAPDLTDVGDPLEFRPDARQGRAACGARLRKAYPILEAFRGCSLMMSTRPDAPSDYALLAAAQPAELHLVADGIQNHVSVRDFSGAAGFADNPLARIPTEAAIGCPPWLETEVAAIGRPNILPEAWYRRVLVRIGRIPVVAPLARELADADRPFTSVIVSQHLARGGLTGQEAELVFYLHQIRALLQRTRGRLLFKAHPRDPHEKLRALTQALGPDAVRVRVTHGAESHTPLEAFPQLAGGRRPLLVWGTSSTALLGVRDWPRVRVSCVDADYIEGEVRRQALQFSRRHGFALVTMQFTDNLLRERDRVVLRRPMILAAHLPAAGLATALQVHTAASTETIRALQEERNQWHRDVAQWRGEAARAINLAGLFAALRDDARTFVVWGAGAAGRRLRALLRTRVAAFIDSDPAKGGTAIDGVPVVPPAALDDPGLRGAYVLVASIHAPQIAERLVALGKSADADFAAISGNDLDALEAVRASIPLAPGELTEIHA
jgi:SAM-dependent methyltransferase